MAVDFPELYDQPLEALEEQAKQLGLDRDQYARRSDLVFAIGRTLGERDGSNYGRGVLEVHGEGFGFLRSPSDNFLPGPDDIYVSQSQIRRFKLQTGDTVIGLVRQPKEGERYLALLRVEAVNGDSPGVDTSSFDSLTAIYPDDRINLAGSQMLRAIDWVAPLGVGQRGLLVAPGHSGRVAVLRELADVLAHESDLHVTVLLSGERPEEIHEWRKHSEAEVVATPFDEPSARHVQVADIVFERARRMVERGDDAVLIIDSMSRLLRHCLAELPPSGRTIGGIDTAALHRIRRWMGAARALAEGGSLTVIGVVSSAADIDDSLVEDLRDVVNWELTLSDALAERGVPTPVDLHRSGTLNGNALLDATEREQRAAFRVGLTGDAYADAMALAAHVEVDSSTTPGD